MTARNPRNDTVLDCWVGEDGWMAEMRSRTIKHTEILCWSSIPFYNSVNPRAKGGPDNTDAPEFRDLQRENAKPRLGQVSKQISYQSGDAQHVNVLNAIT